MTNNKHVAIIGAGAFGTALALAMARGNHHVTLIPQTKDHEHELITHRENKTYFPSLY